MQKKKPQNQRALQFGIYAHTLQVFLKTVILQHFIVMQGAGHEQQAALLAGNAKFLCAALRGGVTSAEACCNASTGLEHLVRLVVGRLSWNKSGGRMGRIWFYGSPQQPKAPEIILESILNKSNIYLLGSLCTFFSRKLDTCHVPGWPNCMVYI